MGRERLMDRAVGGPDAPATGAGGETSHTWAKRHLIIYLVAGGWAGITIVLGTVLYLIAASLVSAGVPREAIASAALIISAVLLAVLIGLLWSRRRSP